MKSFTAKGANPRRQANSFTAKDAKGNTYIFDDLSLASFASFALKLFLSLAASATLAVKLYVAGAAPLE